MTCKNCESTMLGTKHCDKCWTSEVAASGGGGIFVKHESGVFSQEMLLKGQIDSLLDLVSRRDKTIRLHRYIIAVQYFTIIALVLVLTWGLK